MVEFQFGLFNNADYSMINSISDAIRMLMDGYTNREIGEMFGVPANHVTAWVSRARKALGASE